MSRADKPSYVRLPADLKKKIEESAERNHRSLSGEIVFQLEQAYRRQEEKKPIGG